MGRISALILIGLMVIVSGCGTLANEPVIIRTQAVASVTPSPAPDIGRPLQPVSLINGATIYQGAQGCQNCHGSKGAGDGPTAASLTCKVPNLTDPAVARPDTLAAWFAITTNGNGQTQGCLMPPWKGRLTEQQRWDVSAYMLSLHYKSAQLEAGKALYAENCAACHGAKGAGDGPRAKENTRPVTNISDAYYIISHSDQAMYTAVTNGVGAQMPAFPQLSDDQRWAVVDYARSLSWAEMQNPGAATRPETTDDKAIVRMDESRLLLEVSGDAIRVQQGVNFTNTSSQRAYLGKDGVGVRLQLPPGAASIALEADMQTQYTVVNGPAIAPVIQSMKVLSPGETRPLIVSYTLPLGALPFKISQTIDFNLGTLTVFLSEATGLAIADKSFAQGDPVPLTTDAGLRVNYKQYQRGNAMLAGLPVSFTLDSAARLSNEENANRRNTLAIVFALGLAAFGVVGVGVWRIARQ